ncbi:J domain-containing protein [Cytophagaceae bacterium DM2B3-1]|uniref:J domain-containing protein n=1 Tax=Xanthocytophaga flava TaxID=3048013 RepID=A0ABT7CRU9_9BACT|nr:J domain-containing protein [Xanthocytophaga flavus]MDJ1471305.1 J domain-containing protein [Xanthocytophaga flavus]MDJ1495695.1 J domain-containing protein [Xanthocytophaga flavus]
MGIENDYRILGISPGADQAEIKRAYWKKAKAIHPDVNPSDNADVAFVEINNAYERLVNEEKQLIPEYSFLMDLLRPETHQEKALRYAKMWQEEFRRNNESFKRSWAYLPIKIVAYFLWILGIALALTFVFGPPAVSLFHDVVTGLYMAPIMFIGVAFLFGSYQFKKQMNRYL